MRPADDLHEALRNARLLAIPYLVGPLVLVGIVLYFRANRSDLIGMLEGPFTYVVIGGLALISVVELRFRAFFGRRAARRARKEGRSAPEALAAGLSTQMTLNQSIAICGLAIIFFTHNLWIPLVFILASMASTLQAWPRKDRWLDAAKED